METEKQPARKRCGKSLLGKRVRNPPTAKTQAYLVDTVRHVSNYVKCPSQSRKGFEDYRFWLPFERATTTHLADDIAFYVPSGK